MSSAVPDTPVGESGRWYFDSLSMKKIRINELARELEVKAHEILELLPEMGVTEKKTHSSSIDEDVAIKLRRHYGKDESGSDSAGAGPGSSSSSSGSVPCTSAASSAVALRSGDTGSASGM